MKRLLSLFLLLFMVINSFGANYDFQDENGLYYKITSVSFDDNTCEIANPYGADYLTKSPYSGNLTIPSSVIFNGSVYNVTGIGIGAFYKCSALTSITLPDGLMNIGSQAFWDCI